MRELLPVAVAVAAVLAVGAAGIAVDLAERDAGAPEGAGAPRCAVLDRSAVVPEDGALLGAHLDLGRRDLAGYARGLGHRPAVTGISAGLPYGPGEEAELREAVEQVRDDGHALLLTLEPRDGLQAVSGGAAAALAQDLAEFNRAGVPVVVRFGPAMNGPWHEWGRQPRAYVEAFREVAAAVHGAAPGSAMMWSPAYGGGHPFAEDGRAPAPRAPELLDTDDDGALTAADDPYAPYWPGDDVVDWAGMSLRHWGAARPWGENEVPEPGKLEAQLTGDYAGADGDHTAVPDFYAVYGQGRGLPVAITETGAFYAPAAGGAGEPAVKQAWWEQVLEPGLAERFPRLRMITWFEQDGLEPQVDAHVDWRVTAAPELRDAFVAALPEWVRHAPEAGCG